MPQQQGQDIGSPTSNLVVKVTQSPAISPGHWGFVLKLKSYPGGFVFKYSPLLVCCNDNADAVIPCTGTLDDRPPSLLPGPIDGSGQPLLSPELTSSPTVQVQIDEDVEEEVLAGQNTGSPVVNGEGILHTPVSPCLTPSSSFSGPASFLHVYPL